MRSIWLVLILLACDVPSAQLSRRERSTNLAVAGTRSVLFPSDGKPGVQRAAGKCAHIVISEVAKIDPKMIKGTREFPSKMPILRVPPPCYQDSKRGQ